MQGLLSFENAPPLAAPLRFFLTAPLFAVLAGLLVMLNSEVLASRWMPSALAATHLITLGFMLPIMAGALIQILPVVAGASLARPLLTAQVVHGGLSVGALVLAGAFLFSSSFSFILAALLLGGAALLFIIVVGYSLVGLASVSPTLRGIKLALLGLFGTVTLGALLALILALGWSVNLPVLVNLHAGWGFAAWVGVLLAAMATLVVPMFQLTPPYPQRWSWWFSPAVVFFLILWALGVALGVPVLVRLAEAGAALAGMGFATVTLRLQGQRRRARSDTTFLYWQGGLWSIMAALVMLLLAALWPELAEWRGWSPLFGIALVCGGFMSLIIGMLYKIVPFLAWLHLQNAGQGKFMAPSVSKLLPEKRMQGQMLAHFGAFALLVAAAFWPQALLVGLAGAAFTLANAWLAANLFVTVRRYGRHTAEIAEKLKIE